MSKKKPVGAEPMCSEQDVKLIDPIWMPGPVPPNYWPERQHRRAYLLWLGWRLGFRKARDWYRLTANHMRANSGNSILCRYKSPVRAMIDCFPEYDWHEWLFQHVTVGFWDVSDNRRRYLRWLGKQMGFRQARDWYAIRQRDFLRHRGAVVLSLYSSMYDLLQEFLPQLDWDPRKRRQSLSIKEILKSADAYYAEHGRWPAAHSGPAAGTNLTWSGISERLRLGYTGFKTGSSLAAILAEHRGVSWGKVPPPLTKKQILAWADAYYADHGRWPTCRSGVVMGTRETWAAISSAMWHGGRSLKRGSSLANLLEQSRGVRNQRNLPPLSERQIIIWARRHLAVTGGWPSRRSGAIPNTCGETWSRVEGALVEGRRGLTKGSSIPKLLRAYGLK